MKNEIILNLSTKGINEVKDFLNKYKESLNKVEKESVKALTETAYELVSLHCLESNIKNHTSNIRTEYGNDYGKVVTNDDVLIYNEMGTGIVGKNNSHPNPSPEFKGWEYDVNSHGEKGWRYPKDDGSYGWTRGLPSKHMFYDAYNELKDVAGKTVAVELYKNTKNLYK